MNTKIRVLAVYHFLLGIGPLQASSGYYGTAKTADLPVYRYYDRLSSVYFSEITQPPENVSFYWAERHYGNQNPDEGEFFRLDLEIWNLEQHEMNTAETMARSS